MAVGIRVMVKNLTIADLKNTRLNKKTSGKKFKFPDYEMYNLKSDPLEQSNRVYVSKVFAPLKLNLEKFETRIQIKKNDFLILKSVIQDS